MSANGERYGRLQRVGLALGPTLFAGTRLFVSPAGLSPAANAVLASTLWIAVWWMTEAVPIPVTSLLPVLLFPTLGVTSVREAAAPYADPVVFLFLGGFLVALAIQRWELHRRIALNVLLRVGDDSRRLILGFMLVTAFLSMWVSNTATAMMMVPIGMAVVAQLRAFRAPADATPAYASATLQTLDAGETSPDAGETTIDAGETSPDAGETTIDAGETTIDAGETAPDGDEATPSNFGVALMLGIAYAASAGGVATLIGTPPNAILVGVAESSLGVQIGFVQWMLFGVPLAVVFLVVAWLVLVTLLRPETRTIPESRTVVREQLAALGPMSTGERRVVVVFAVVVLGWLLRPFVLEPLVPGVTDTVVALVGGILVFLVPVDLRRGEFLLDWEYTTRVPWGVLLLFGAGFSLARAFQVSGLDRWLAGSLTGLQGVALVWILLAVATLVVFLTEVTSNTATASLFVPIMVSLGASLLVSPLVLMVTVAVAASFAFMLPVATPPNAIVFGSGYLSIPQMARVGFWLNLLGILFLTAMTYFWLPVAWGV